MGQASNQTFWVPVVNIRTNYSLKTTLHLRVIICEFSSVFARLQQQVAISQNAHCVTFETVVLESERYDKVRLTQ